MALGNRKAKPSACSANCSHQPLHAWPKWSLQVGSGEFFSAIAQLAAYCIWAVMRPQPVVPGAKLFQLGVVVVNCRRKSPEVAIESPHLRWVAEAGQVLVITPL